MSFTETSQVVSREWKELSDAKKNTYIRTAEKEQEKHRVLKANWEAKEPAHHAPDVRGGARTKTRPGVESNPKAVPIHPETRLGAETAPSPPCTLHHHPRV